jgi:hypothetical protein
MHGRLLGEAPRNLSLAIREVETAVSELRANHDRLASHIFISRCQYRIANDTKSGKRRGVLARLSFNRACEPGFRGSLSERERLMGAISKR